jgi:hypothetical protein
VCIASSVRYTINHADERSRSETAEGNDPINTCTEVHPALSTGTTAAAAPEEVEMILTFLSSDAPLSTGAQH